MGTEINNIKAAPIVEKIQPPKPSEAKSASEASIISAEAREAPLNLSHALASLGNNPDKIFDFLKKSLANSDKPEVDIVWMQYAGATSETV
jgi:hypothetical protein